jgi:hypothetical protein
VHNEASKYFLLGNIEAALERCSFDGKHEKHKGQLSLYFDKLAGRKYSLSLAPITIPCGFIQSKGQHFYGGRSFLHKLPPIAFQSMGLIWAFLAASASNGLCPIIVTKELLFHCSLSKPLTLSLPGYGLCPQIEQVEPDAHGKQLHERYI